MSDKYTLTVTESQLRVIQNACEEYLRTRLGQFWQLVEDVSEAKEFGYVAGELDDERYIKRDAARVLMDGAYNLLRGPFKQKSADMLIAEDLYTQIRHYRYMELPANQRSEWCVSFDTPIILSSEPPAEIRR